MKTNQEAIDVSPEVQENIVRTKTLYEKAMRSLLIGSSGLGASLGLTSNERQVAGKLSEMAFDFSQQSKASMS